MKSFLINAKDREITEIEYRGDLHHAYELIGCSLIEPATFNRQNGDCVYVDEEGLLKDPEHFFLIEGFPQPLAGNAIVVSVDRRGRTISPHVDLVWLKANVTWMTTSDVWAYAKTHRL